MLSVITMTQCDVTPLHLPSESTWTDATGTAHYRDCSDELERTLCGLTVSTPDKPTHAVLGCDECVRADITRYARAHLCGVSCRD